VRRRSFVRMCRTSCLDMRMPLSNWGVRDGGKPRCSSALRFFSRANCSSRGARLVWRRSDAPPRRRLAAAPVGDLGSHDSSDGGKYCRYGRADCGRQHVARAPSLHLRSRLEMFEAIRSPVHLLCKFGCAASDCASEDV
jgi:hypothetical protein